MRMEEEMYGEKDTLELQSAQNEGKAGRMGSVKFTAEPVPCSARPIRYDTRLCIGCGRCAAVCQCDVLLPSAEKGRHPVILYPGECYYCGACVMVCPRPGAIRLEHPLMNRAKFVPVRGGKNEDIPPAGGFLAEERR